MGRPVVFAILDSATQPESRTAGAEGARHSGPVDSPLTRTAQEWQASSEGGDWRALGASVILRAVLDARDDPAARAWLVDEACSAGKWLALAGLDDSTAARMRALAASEGPAEAGREDCGLKAGGGTALSDGPLHHVTVG
jgi:hypothetical protein